MKNPPMQQSEFQLLIERYADVLSRIRAAAHDLHASVNQTYGNDHPYGYHLDMVVDAVRTYGHYVCASADDVLPLFFGAYFHDSIEDARLTYNDVTATARHFMSDAQAFVAAEIVYALTNDKGRTRAERAGERYYQGIRVTPYAPFVKMADRLANITYSCKHTDTDNSHMREVYRRELPHFLASVAPSETDDGRFSLPAPMVEAVHALLTD
jgi:(p)ppGpp synthase/HD superfamily hydrolase